MARISYADEADMPPGYEDLVVSSLQGRPINAYRVLGSNPEVLKGERDFAAAVWHDTGLSDRRRELVILAVASGLRSAYEWHQHVRIAPGEGVTEEELLAIAEGDFDAFEPAEATLMRYAVAVIDRAVDDELFEAVAAHFDESTIVGITLLAGGYQMVAGFLDAFDVDLEEAFVGWDLHDYASVVGTDAEGP